ncbi:MAG: hypothetical protein FJ164_03290 [Gammaproteobacteria bacterium]|nr:hypothetical protein [Gammaproteobacteria bacterium]
MTGDTSGEFPAELPAIAHLAWSSYHAMVASKTRHFDFLSELDRKHEGGGRRSLAEIAHLEQLLELHTRAVKAFGQAVAQLATEDPGARDSLLTHLHGLNAALGAEPEAKH